MVDDSWADALLGFGRSRQQGAKMSLESEVDASANPGKFHSVYSSHRVYREIIV